jgi:tetratricopeptide (TPR) repeat protein
MNTIIRNNTGNKTKQDLIEGFVVRTKPFKLIEQEIAASESNKPEQNYLIIGQRGAGKTTLLYRLKYAIEDTLTASKGVVPIMFTEEQYNLSDLIDLWEYIADLLEDQGYFKGLMQKMQQVPSASSREEYAYFLLEDMLTNASKKIIVFLENIDAFFKKIGVAGQKRLREVLITSQNIRLIASATSYFEAVTDYSMPFYEFFKIIELKGLTSQESKELLLKIGEQYGEQEKIAQIIKTSPKRLESLRRLTGGVPRTISYLFEIFLDNENGKAIKDLYKLVEDLTFLYKSELDQLSSQQQKIVDIIARNWDAIAVKDITVRTRFESKQVSSILQTLEKNQIIEKVNTKSKNNLYRIRERFMNIWYLMRFGKQQDKENVVWLVRFYDLWCDKSELAQHINKHLRNMIDGKYDLTAALYMSNTFLACEKVSADLRHSIYKTTKAIWPQKSIENLLYSDKDLYDRIRELTRKKKFDEAIEVLNDINQKDEKYYMFSSFVYSMSGNNKLAEENAEEAIKLNPQNGVAALRIGIFNCTSLHDVEKALRYLKKALELGEHKAAYYLGVVYLKNDNQEMALQYLTLAADHQVQEAYLPLAGIFFQEKKYALAQEFSEKALKANIHDANINLGLLYEIRQEYTEAERYYKTALERGLDKALLYLGQMEYLKPEPNQPLVRDYLHRAYIKKVKGSTLVYAQFLLDLPESKAEGIKILTNEAATGNSMAAHILGHVYSDDDKLADSDKYFMMAYEMGARNAAICHAIALFEKNRNDKRAYALNLMEQNRDVWEGSSASSNLTYALILLWNDEVDRSIKIFTEQIESLQKLSDLKLEKMTKVVQARASMYLTLLISKGLLKAALRLFENEEGVSSLRNIFKPIYFALMYYLQTDYPQEYLKAGDELKETVTEIIDTIDHLKKRLKKAQIKP